MTDNEQRAKILAENGLGTSEFELLAFELGKKNGWNDCRKFCYHDDEVIANCIKALKRSLCSCDHGRGGVVECEKCQALAAFEATKEKL